MGSGDAANLGQGGHLLVRLEGRLPVQANGYRVAADRLARLAALIQDQPGSPAGIEPTWVGGEEADSDRVAASDVPEQEHHAEQEIEEAGDDDDEDESESFGQATAPQDPASSFSEDDARAHVEVGDRAAYPSLATPTVEPSNGLRSAAGAGGEAERSAETDGPTRSSDKHRDDATAAATRLVPGHTGACVWGYAAVATTETVDEACWELLVYLAINDPPASRARCWPTRCYRKGVSIAAACGSAAANCGSC